MATKQATKARNEKRNVQKVWTEEERAAMVESARERKVAARRGRGDERAEGLNDLLAKIAEMPQPDRAMAERVHEIVTTTAPSLLSKTYYGMPAYAKDGKIVCFFQSASKFKVRYSTLGFQPDAKLDDGEMWPIAWALTSLTAADERRIAELVRRAVS